MKLDAVVRGQGVNQPYKDTGLERLVVHVEKGTDQSTPNPNSFRLPVALTIGGKRFIGGLIVRTSPPPLISISPDLTDEEGNPTNLSSVFDREGIQRNDKVVLEVEPIQVRLG